MNSTEILLSVKDVVKTYGSGSQLRRAAAGRRVRAVSGVSFEIGLGECVGVVGESGCGKSTLARVIMGLTTVDSGNVLLRGHPIEWRVNRPRKVHREVQMVFQDPHASLNPLISIGDAIAEPAIVHNIVAPNEARQHVSKLLDQVGLTEAVAARRPGELSGGQCQRAAIARALASDPSVIVADEAVSALDVSIQAQVLALFRELAELRGLSVMFIGHQLPVVANIADRVIVMYMGEIVEHGEVGDLFSRPRHPYTTALLKSQPGRNRRGKETVLKGDLPSQYEDAEGCCFLSRCPLAAEVCRTPVPDVVVGDGHVSRCHFASDLPSTSAHPSR